MESVIKKLEENNFMIPNFKKSNFQALNDTVNGRNSELTGERENKIFFIVDGFGMNLLNELRSRNKRTNETLAKASLNAVTTIFPSATLCVLSSLFSGMLPSEHGVIGDIQPVGGFGLVNIMYLSEMFGDISKHFDGIEYEMIYPKDYNLQKLQAKNGIGIFPKTIEMLPSGRQILNELHNLEYSTIEDLYGVINSVINKGSNSIILVYYGNLDHIEHMHGYLSDESIAEAAKVVELIGSINTLARNGNYSVIVTADHGHVIVKGSEFKTFDSKSKLASLLKRPPWGNARTMFLESKEGKEEKVEEAFNEDFVDYSAIFRSEDMLAAGIFGPEKPLKKKRENFGTHIAISKGNYSINYAEKGQYEPWFDRSTGQIGTHGGMSQNEMQVPLLVFE